MDIEFIYSLFAESNGVTTDSRVCPENSMFIALKGETFDGNAYAEKALESGCKYALVSDESIANGKNIFYVGDTLKCLQMLASHHRDVINPVVIGITGTNGKTTTKELVATVMASSYADCLLYTQGNFNNHIGVPLTLLKLNKSHKYAIIEMGANHPGEIKTLVNIAHPNCGLITNVGRAHLAGFGSLEGVLNTKCELYDYLRANNGFVFVDASNKMLMQRSEGMNRILYNNSDAKTLECNPFLKFAYEGIETQTNLIGDYNIVNALAAVEVGKKFNIPVAQSLSAIASYQPKNNRSQWVKTEKNNLIIDAYNANPTSMAAALNNFKNSNFERKAVVLGDMRELGDESDVEHSKVVCFLKHSGVERIILVGECFKKAASGEFETYNNVDELKQALQESPVSGYTILVKGSNSIGLVKVVDLL